MNSVFPANEPSQVEVAVVSAPSKVNPYEKWTLRELFEELARLNTFGDIEDPVEYIRELRRDRALPGREE